MSVSLEDVVGRGDRPHRRGPSRPFCSDLSLVSSSLRASFRSFQISCRLAYGLSLRRSIAMSCLISVLVSIPVESPDNLYLTHC